MSKAERDASHAILRASVGQERLILATGRYLGEGFDDARLDTLFLTMPISWKGTLAQYVGRMHRRHDGKTDALVVDYVDEHVPMLARMAAKRRPGIGRSATESNKREPFPSNSSNTGPQPSNSSAVCQNLRRKFTVDADFRQ